MAIGGMTRTRNKDNSQRKFRGSGPRPDKTAYKRESTLVRLEQWRSLSVDLQIADLDRRLGKGIGAVKQRARIQAKALPTSLK